ncbi:hypothetical protein DFA_03933 [Cavenderia fasciculata]|uniref:Uncharacterized protein n=1 Tax=Cavenderia fasciculata TaxID=261658 RepID=F4Q0T8_CACFS|nr:uncharacterized protein DFA_03933 [Cavenderia fasciculata]EGG18439.1 hypothetical protein DFA_03933 [Cavenderia fasciculata]|eukprot:XP_004366343.1 hypothetical protein DFA_03933 [Cavenderia fasciculata]
MHLRFASFELAKILDCVSFICINVYNNRFIIKTIVDQMKKLRSAEIFAPDSTSPSSRPRYYRYSQFNDIGGLLSTKESINLLKYKFARGDTSKLTFEPTREFYCALFHAKDVSLQHQIIDFLGDAVYLEAFYYIKSVIPHHSVFIRLLDYYRENNVRLAENIFPEPDILEASPIIPIEVYQSLLGPNKSLSYFFPFPESFVMVANQDLINQVKLSDPDQAKRLFEKTTIESLIYKFMVSNSESDLRDSDKLGYLSRVVENITIIYKDNPHNGTLIDLAQKRTEYGGLLESQSLEKIDMLVLLDLVVIYGLSHVPLNWFMTTVFTLDDIKLLGLVLDHPVIQSYQGTPIYQYNSQLVGFETFKQMTTLPKLQYTGPQEIFTWSANTLEKVRYMHTEMGYQFDALSLSMVSMWHNRDAYLYVLDNIANKSPGFLNTYVQLIFRSLEGQHDKETSEKRIGYLDLLEHLAQQGYLTVPPLHNQTSEFINILLTIVGQSSKLGMIDTLQDIIDTYWPVFKVDKHLTFRSLIRLAGNATQTHHLIVRLLDNVAGDIDTLELLKSLAEGDRGGVETTLYLLNKQLVGKEILEEEVRMVEIVKTLVKQGHLEEFIQMMTFLHQHKYKLVLRRLVNKIDISDAFATSSFRDNPFHDYYMRLHYLYKDAGHRRRSFINVFKVISLRRLMETRVSLSKYIFIQDLIDKYDQRANITAILLKSPTTFAKRFAAHYKAMKSVHSN